MSGGKNRLLGVLRALPADTVCRHLLPGKRKCTRVTLSRPPLFFRFDRLAEEKRRPGAGLPAHPLTGQGPHVGVCLKDLVDGDLSNRAAPAFCSPREDPICSTRHLDREYRCSRRTRAPEKVAG